MPRRNLVNLQKCGEVVDHVSTADLFIRLLLQVCVLLEISVAATFTGSAGSKFDPVGSILVGIVRVFPSGVAPWFMMWSLSFADLSNLGHRRCISINF